MLNETGQISKKSISAAEGGIARGMNHELRPPTGNFCPPGIQYFNPYTLPSVKRIVRKGKWLEEEEAYTRKLIDAFNEGYLEIQAGTTLRSFLSEKLSCDPMRITKKFAGSSCIGKQIYTPSASKVDPNKLKAAHDELTDLAKRFREKIEFFQPESDFYSQAPYQNISSTARLMMIQHHQQQLWGGSFGLPIFPPPFDAPPAGYPPEMFAMVMGQQQHHQQQQQQQHASMLQQALYEQHMHYLHAQALAQAQAQAQTSLVPTSAPHGSSSSPAPSSASSSSSSSSSFAAAVSGGIGAGRSSPSGSPSRRPDLVDARAAFPPLPIAALPQLPPMYPYMLPGSMGFPFHSGGVFPAQSAAADQGGMGFPSGAFLQQPGFFSHPAPAAAGNHSSRPPAAAAPAPAPAKAASEASSLRNSELLTQCTSGENMDGVVAEAGQCTSQPTDKSNSRSSSPHNHQQRLGTAPQKGPRGGRAHEAFNKHHHHKKKNAKVSLSGSIPDDVSGRQGESYKLHPTDPTCDSSAVSISAMSLSTDTASNTASMSTTGKSSRAVNMGSKLLMSFYNTAVAKGEGDRKSDVDTGSSIMGGGSSEGATSAPSDPSSDPPSDPSSEGSRAGGSVEENGSADSEGDSDESEMNGSDNNNYCTLESLSYKAGDDDDDGGHVGGSGGTMQQPQSLSESRKRYAEQHRVADASRPAGGTARGSGNPRKHKSDGDREGEEDKYIRGPVPKKARLNTKASTGDVETTRQDYSSESR